MTSKQYIYTVSPNLNETCFIVKILTQKHAEKQQRTIYYKLTTGYGSLVVLSHSELGMINKLIEIIMSGLQNK